MFEATVTGSGLQSILDPVQAIVTESRFQLGEDDFTTAAVDPANVAMIRFNLESEGFEEHESDDGGLIGVNLERLDDIAGMADNDSEVRLVLDDEERTLTITIDDQLEYTLALIDPSSIRDEPDIPNLDYAAQITLTGSDLNRGIKAADMVSDHVAFGADPDEEVFTIAADGDTDDVELKLDSDEDLVGFDVEESVESLFALEYLKDMNGAIPSDAEILIELGSEVPVQMHFETMDGHAEITYMLAPRIDTE